MVFQLCKDFLVRNLRHSDLKFILLHKSRIEVLILHAFKISGKAFILYLEGKAVFTETDRHGIILCLVGAHADTEAGVPAFLAFHHDNLNPLVHPLIIHILKTAVLKVYLFLVMLGMDVTGAHENQELLGAGFALNEFILGKIKQGLGYGA